MTIRTALALVLLAAAAPAAAIELPADPMAGAVYWVQHADEYRALCVQTYRAASEAVLDLAGTTSGPWAVVLDVDETVLSNLKFQIQLIEAGKSYDRQLWDRWCERAEAEALPGVLGFLHLTRDVLGGKVALITNRAENVRRATELNLTRQGIPYDALLMKEAGPGASSDKTHRRALVESGAAFGSIAAHRILILVGDQSGDLYPVTGDQWRDRRAEIGRRLFVLPNPMYGAWLN